MKMNFKKNLGLLDRIIRAIIGFGLLISGFFLTSWIRVVVFVLAVLLFISALAGYCTIYDIFGISTLEKDT